MLTLDEALTRAEARNLDPSVARARLAQSRELDGKRRAHLAGVTNMGWEGGRLPRWHRERQGAVEHAHGVLENDLAGGELPRGRLGANAAGWRLDVLEADRPRLPKASAPSAAMGIMTPKRPRFRLFAAAGRLVSHGRQVRLRVREKLPAAQSHAQARHALLTLGSLPPACPSGQAAPVAGADAFPARR